MSRVPFKRPGTIAIAAQAMGELFPQGAPIVALASPPGGVAVVDIRGPLTSYTELTETGECFDSYEAIRVRVANALTSSARAVVLKINSPGGDASGCFELASEIRAMADQCGKRVYAYADGMAASAAYAIACGAHEIWAPLTATVGSIGVITALVDTTAADAFSGLRVQLVTSGARKADGNPHAPITDEAIAAAQARVSELGEMFCGLVARNRGIPLASVRALEAGLFHGPRAVNHGLVNGLCSFADLLTKAAAGPARGNVPSPKAKTMSNTRSSTESPEKLLRGVLADPDASDEDKEAARKMLKAIEKPSDKEAPEAKRAAAKFTASVHARLDAFEAKQARRAVAVATTSAKSSAASEARENELANMNAAMGIAQPSRAIRHEGNRSYIGVMSPAEARAEIARRAEIAKLEVGAQ